MSGPAALPGRNVCQKFDFTSRNALSEIMGLRCAEQNARHVKTMHCQKLWDPCAQNNTSQVSKNALSIMLGLLRADQDVGNLKACTFRNSGTPGRRTQHRKSQKMHFQEFWDSCTQNKTSEISNSCTFRNSWTPVRRTERRKSKKNCTFKNSGLGRARAPSLIITLLSGAVLNVGCLSTCQALTL